MIHFAVRELIDIIGNDDILTTQQIAELLGKSPETVRRWCRRGQLQSLCPGHFRITGKELKAFITAKYNVVEM